MRIVLDTNVFVSSLLSKPGSTTRRIRKAWEKGAFEVCTSEYQIEEIRRILNEKFRVLTTTSERAELIAEIRKACILIEPKQKRGLSKDEDDNPLLDLAVEAGAQYMVSGDEHVVSVKHKRLKILTPAQFLEQIKQSL
ncbi:putative toxin-antitoxin system toxin component, PIN family [Meiothermus granaticius]|uniref:Putative toxin-antitoxin system toxin component, PIN family n=1 Tax=Meiothermus granaticius NBRC 107808 TaxID=1227551 RepID=A0A399F8Z6_9DEIN|nr:putative toxin-antitoxin system toxin component, PIN family [Meiothermus granaticius]RIH92718.1 putative toxin-antitoxin system toxin component, PIN family [Meiothermus granaticius NBRC 107808]GEM87771.1 PIN domain-containing protein [Meiothermus granaticius NBRC 107808]